MAADIKKKYPLASKYLGKVRAIFDEFDKDKDEKLSLNECATMFETLSKKVTSLPAVSALCAYSCEAHTRLPKLPASRANIWARCSASSPNPARH